MLDGRWDDGTRRESDDEGLAEPGSIHQGRRKVWALLFAAAAMVIALAVGIEQWPTLNGFRSAGVAEAAPERPAGSTFRDCPDCPLMVVVGGGVFAMGSPASEEGRAPKEPTPRAVSVNAFALGTRPVSFAEWDSCVADGGCNLYRPPDLGWGRADRPAIDVSWEQAQSYVTWLNGKVGPANLGRGRTPSGPYRLPSEAEWEYAARAGTTTARYWGEEIGTGNANCNGCGGLWGGKQTAPVGSFPPNPWGLYDMLGNVYQWTADCWHESYAGAPVDGSAWASGDCAARVIRGGSWGLFPRFIRAASRLPYDTGGRSSDTGFRVARTL